MEHYGLLGYPVSHSLSSFMHNAGFKALGIDAEYSLCQRQPREVEGFIRSLEAQGFSGINVTIPYKETVIPFLDSISAEARQIGAVNTITVGKGKLEGHNTDGMGFLRHLTGDVGFDPSGRRVAIVGCGGAARAVSVYLARSGAGEISLFDVDKGRREALLAHLSRAFPSKPFSAADSIEGLQADKADLLVNATPLGMKKGDPLPVPVTALRKGMVVYDLVYNPSQTPLLAEARAAGARTANGLGMLLYQGVAAFELWTGAAAPIDVMRKALEKALEEKER